jgi:hypothetical protein
MRVYGPLEHYNYQVLDKDCSCRVCEDWRNKKAVVEKRGDLYTRVTRTDALDARLSYFAAATRRDLYCESSYHATRNWWGPYFMNWLDGVTIEVDKTDRNWWNRVASRLPLLWWFRQFDLAQSPSMSGAVLIASGRGVLGLIN